MGEEWIVRVEGKEYGPVGIDELRAWRREGRLIPANEVRQPGEERWIPAGELVEVFSDIGESLEARAARVPKRTLSRIILESARLYRRGFWQFLGLTLVIAVPSICAQLSGLAVRRPSGAEIDLQSLFAAAFGFAMLLLSIASWPVFIAGVQLLTAELAAGRTPRMTDLLRQALTFWPRVAPLCLLVYGAYFFWTALPVGFILLIVSGTPSLGSFFFVLVLLAFQVWIVARLFVNFLFWQQCAVLEGANVGTALRESKKLGRSGQNLPWFRRPAWRGALLASIWCAFVLVLSVGPSWSLIWNYFRELATSPDPQAVYQSLMANSKLQGFNPLNFALGLLQTLLRPLLGIAFVFLYFDVKEHGEGGGD